MVVCGLRAHLLPATHKHTQHRSTTYGPYFVGEGKKKHLLHTRDITSPGERKRDGKTRSELLRYGCGDRWLFVTHAHTHRCINSGSLTFMGSRVSCSNNPPLSPWGLWGCLIMPQLIRFARDSAAAAVSCFRRSRAPTTREGTPRVG